MTKFLLGALKRIMLSLLSAALAVSFWALLCTLYSATRHPDVTGLWTLWLYGVVVIVGFGYRAYLVAIPAVLFFTNLRRWRFWALLGFGTAIGALTFLYEMVSTSVGNSRPEVGDLILLGISSVISSTATLIYLLLLRHSQGIADERPKLQSLFGNL